MKKIITANNAPRAIGPYSQAVEAAGFVFVSGQIAIEPESGTVIQGGVRDQTRRIMANALNILTAAGCAAEDVVKTTIYLKNMDDFAAVNEVYGKCFPANMPARSTVEVSRLPRDVSVEIDFIAWKGGNPHPAGARGGSEAE